MPDPARLLRRQAYVDGRWVDADSGATFEVTDPATGEVLASVPRMGAAETHRAIAAAEAAMKPWAARTAGERARSGGDGNWFAAPDSARATDGARIRCDGRRGSARMGDGGAAGCHHPLGGVY